MFEFWYFHAKHIGPVHVQKEILIAEDVIVVQDHVITVLGHQHISQRRRQV